MQTWQFSRRLKEVLESSEVSSLPSIGGRFFHDEGIAGTTEPAAVDDVLEGLQVGLPDAVHLQLGVFAGL